MFVPKISPAWDEALGDIFKTKEYQQLRDELIRSVNSGTKIHPSLDNILSAFKLTDFNDIKVVIIGQDPYHGPNQATGLAFAVPNGMPRPPTLKNIMKELAMELHQEIDLVSSSLEGWAQQGVLLLNTCWTVEEGRPNSHRYLGWNLITDKVVKQINDRLGGVVFLLWGDYAKKYSQAIDRTKHAILEAGHPSPLSARLFFGCNHFVESNKLLKTFNKKPINWIDIKGVAK